MLDEQILLELKYLRTLRRLCRGVAHDYNNMFAGLGGQLSLIRKHHGSGTGDRHRFELVDELLERGVQRTELLHQSARYDADAEPGVHTLSGLVERAAAALQVCFRNHRIDVVQSAGRVKVRCRQMEGVLLLFYLAENGLEAMAPGETLQLRVDVPVGYEMQQVVVSVRDSGPGIAPEVRDWLLAADTGAIRPQSSEALGLYAARVLARRWGVAITYQDSSGGGIISLTVPVVDTSAGQLSEEASTGNAGRQATGGPQVFFIVEDDRPLREMIVGGLQRHGHVAYAAGSCREARERFRAVHESVTTLLIDIGLVDGTGVDCAAALRAIDGRPQLIFMSGDVPDPGELAVDAMFLKKPFTIRRLEEMVLHG